MAEWYAGTKPLGENWIQFAYWPDGSFAVFESEYLGKRRHWVHRIRKDYTVRAKTDERVFIAIK